MRNETRAFLSCGIALPLMLCACTSIPDIRVRYYLPRTEVLVKVTRMLTCVPDPGNRQPTIHEIISVDSAVPEYFADTDTPYQFDLGAYDHRFSDVTAGFTFFDDGRLKSINTISTGKGKETIEAVAAIVTAQRTERNAANASEQSPSPLQRACTSINDSPRSTAIEGTNLKLLTLTYEAVVSLSRTGTIENKRRIDGMTTCKDTPADGDLLPDRSNGNASTTQVILALTPTFGSKLDHCRIMTDAGDLRLLVNKTTTPAQPAQVEIIPKSATEDFLKNYGCAPPPFTSSKAICVAQLAPRHIAIQRRCGPAIADCGTDPWVEIGTLLVADSAAADPLPIPVPSPKAFGGATFTMALAESGAVTELSYFKSAAGDTALGALPPLITLSTDPEQAKQAEQADAAKLSGLREQFIYSALKPK